MRRLALALLPVVAVLAAAGSGGAAPSGAPRVGSAPLDPAHMRPLPAQGLAVQRADGLHLLGLNGRSYGRLVGFKLAQNANLNARSLAFQNLAQALSDRLLIVHLHTHWYVLDSHGSELHPLADTRVELPGGTVLIAHGSGNPKDGYTAPMTVQRGGRRVTAIGPTDLYGSSGGILYTGAGTALDPASGTLWRMGHRCVPAGVEQTNVLALCPRTQSGPVDLVLVSRDGGRRVVAHFPHVPFPVAGALSPDGRYVTAALSFGCGPSYSFVVPTAGGQARSMLGQTHQPFVASTVLGWSAGGRIVAWIARSTPDCEHESKAGMYEIDPRTFSHRLVTTTFAPMWNPAPRG